MSIQGTVIYTWADYQANMFRSLNLCDKCDVSLVMGPEVQSCEAFSCGHLYHTACLSTNKMSDGGCYKCYLKEIPIGDLSDDDCDSTGEILNIVKVANKDVVVGDEEGADYGIDD